MATFKNARRAPRLPSSGFTSNRRGSSSSRSIKRTLAVILLVLLLVTGLLWLRSHNWDLRAGINSMTGGGQPVSTGFAGSGVETYSTASDVLNTLTVAKPYNGGGYQRSAYGEAWEDIDGNGCDQRNDILTRDLTNLDIGKNCKVLSGTLTDPYTAETIDFTRGEKSSESVPIDHVVSLSNAWSSGAWQWSVEERTLIANDPLNLQAAGQASNTAKSNKDAASWLPQTGYRCEYVARQISVKAAYHLTVTSAEKKAMQGVLATCPAQPAYRSTFAKG